jgi:bacterioferritin (cytochrome b1)
LAATNHQQEEVQQRLAVNLQHYQQVFHEVERAASQLLGQIDQHLHHYMATTQQGFEHLTRSADEHFANASRHLGDTVNGLDEHLQDLTDMLERFGRVGGTNGHQ